MDVRNKATRIDLFSLRTPQMRAFHMSWFAFFLCFFAWFGIAPLMAVVREELNLTKEQIGNTIIASVAITIFARLLIGWMCDRIGPRLSYTTLLLVGSLPVMGIGLSSSYQSFLLFRLAIGMIRASFVITQYHTSVMFAPNCVGTANATSAGWGNLGGGVTQMVMPLVFAGFVALGFANSAAWRLAMVAAGAVCFVTGLVYFRFTTDLPDGNFSDVRKSLDTEASANSSGKGSFLLAARDVRVWALFLVYAACFGIELTINNIAAIYYMDYFHLGLSTAGLVAGLFGLMNIFARTLGGFISDRFVERGGLQGRVRWLFIALLVEGVALLLFSRMTVLALAIPTMIIFSLFVQMSEGATYSVVPFINRKAIGSVSGIVGAGGNMGAVCAGFLFRIESMTYPQVLLILGFLVVLFSFSTFLVRFSPADEKTAESEFAAAIARRRLEHKERPAWPDLIPGLKNLRPMDALRMYLGIALVVKGVYFIMNMAELESALGGQLGQSQTLISWGVVFAHVVAGASLALGFATRVSAAANAVVLFGAMIFSLVSADQSGLLMKNVDFQFTTFVFFCLILLVWRGAGPWSLDHLVNQDIQKDPVSV
jgi:NNP family nitrate/nitrite transporter-like MFS transporter